MPWFLPDGTHLLFLALASGQATGVIWATSIDEPARVRIVESNGGARYADGWLLSTSTTSSRALVAQRFDPVRLTIAGEPLPVRDGLVGSTTAGVNLGFSVAASGVLVVDRPPPGAALVSQLTWVDRAGRSLSTVGPAGQIGEWALAPDETRVLTTTGGDLWLFAPPRSEGTRLTYQARASRPLWARDGRHVLFTGRGPTVFAPLTLTLGATDAAPVIGLGASFAHFEDVTRDGQYLVFKADAQVGRLEVWLQHLSTPDAVRPLVQGQFEATQPRVSPDGHWLAFTLSLPSGPAVFAQPFDRPGERIQVSPAGGIGPIWRDDSRELYYEGPGGLMAVPMSGRAGVLEAGTPQRLFPLHTQGYVVSQPHNVEVAAHGQKFLVNAIVGDSDNVPLEVTVNWMAGLEK